MNTVATGPFSKIHYGRNIKRLREILGVKQEYIAAELDVTQQFVSKLEQKEVIEDEMLEKVAKILNVPVNAIKNLNDELTTNIITTSYHDDSGENHTVNYHFNPIDKVVELYERLLASEEEKLASEKEKVAMLEKLLSDK
jgi:transcriptional regulator with XRE-family HTH domain